MSYRARRNGKELTRAGVTAGSQSENPPRPAPPRPVTNISWLKKFGFQSTQVRKSAYIDGHEKPDVVFYLEESFLPKSKELEP